MSDITNNPFPQIQHQSLSTSDQGALIRRSDQVSQANVEKFQSEIKLPFLLHNERMQHELKKRELIRAQQQVASVDKSLNGSMTNIKHLPHGFQRLKRRLKSSEKSFSRLLKKLARKFNLKNKKR